MPASARIIRVLDDTYTLEIEVEAETSEDLVSELMQTSWGRKMAYLLQRMLPNVPELPSDVEEFKRMEEERKKKEQEIFERGIREGKAQARREFYEERVKLEQRIKELEEELKKFEEVKELLAKKVKEELEKQTEEVEKSEQAEESA